MKIWKPPRTPTNTDDAKTWSDITRSTEVWWRKAQPTTEGDVAAVAAFFDRLTAASGERYRVTCVQEPHLAAYTVYLHDVKKNVTVGKQVSDLDVRNNAQDLKAFEAQVLYELMELAGEEEKKLKMYDPQKDYDTYKGYYYTPEGGESCPTATAGSIETTGASGDGLGRGQMWGTGQGGWSPEDAEAFIKKMFGEKGDVGKRQAIDPKLREELVKNVILKVSPHGGQALEVYIEPPDYVLGARVEVVTADLIPMRYLVRRLLNGATEFAWLLDKAKRLTTFSNDYGEWLYDLATSIKAKDHDTINSTLHHLHLEWWKEKKLLVV